MEERAKSFLRGIQYGISFGSPGWKEGEMVKVQSRHNKSKTARKATMLTPAAVLL